MPKPPSVTDTPNSTASNNKGKGKALQQPVSVATRVLPPRKRVSALVSNTITSTNNTNSNNNSNNNNNNNNTISPSNSNIASRSTSASSYSPSSQTNSSPPPPLPASSSSTSSSSSASSSPDEAPISTTTSTIRRLSERMSHLHSSYIAYSPRTDPTLYLDQLDTPMSDVREKKRRARPVTSFTELNVAPPISSKRSRHHPRSRVHHAQQKYQERQAAAAAAAATAAKAAATALAYQQQQVQKQKPAPPKLSFSPSSSNNSANAAAVNRSSSTSSSSSSTAAAAAALQRRGPEYAYPRDSLQVQLAQDLPVIDDKALNEKAKEKEYWRRQRRVFVRSRFITNEEATAIANSVYKSNPVGPQDRIVVTFQANIANFRSKWRKLLKELVKKFAINRSLVTAQDSTPFEREVRSKIDVAMLQKIWGHWLADPFVDEEAFYANPQNVETLTVVTVQAICVTLRYHHGLMKERDFRKQLDDLDKYTRNIELPDPFSSTH